MLYHSGLLALWGSNDLDHDGGGAQGRDLLLYVVSGHLCASGSPGVGVQVLTDIHITLHDGVVGVHSQEW